MEKMEKTLEDIIILRTSEVLGKIEDLVKLILYKTRQRIKTIYETWKYITVYKKYTKNVIISKEIEETMEEQKKVLDILSRY